MKKAFILATLLILIMSTLGYIIHNSKTQKNNLVSLNIIFENIKLLDKDFDIYLANGFEYNNFDQIEEKIKEYNSNIDVILSNKILAKKFSERIETLRTSHISKIKDIRKIKSYKAILNNSFRIIQKIKRNIKTKDLDNIYVQILTLDKNPEIDEIELLTHIKNFNVKNQYEEYFIIHSLIIFEYLEKLQNKKTHLDNLLLGKQLKTLHKEYELYSNDLRRMETLATNTLFILLLFMIVIYLLYTFKLITLNTNLLRFKKAVENSDNIVVITELDHTIKYVNEAFTRTTGYTAQEAIGKKPSILNSGLKQKEFYDELKATINSGKKWAGEFINIDKYGKLSYEKATITPIFDQNNKIKEFMAIKLDITNDTIKNQQLKEQESLLIQQSKMASMGEMLENIAHQWRQPLSIISTVTTGIVVQKELGISEEKDEIEKLNYITESVQYLSNTINDFRDFFKKDKNQKTFKLEDTYKKILKILATKFNSRNIIFIENIKTTEVMGLENELIQVLINILNNARDILETSKNKERLIFIDISSVDDNAIIKITDNGGGVPEHIIDKVFEPYFTTKHKSQGTGIGLYMSYEMITKHMKGTLSVKNVQFDYKGVYHKGASFIIEIPLNCEGKQEN